MSEKKLYLVAIVGAIICFVGDNLLGYFVPSADFGNKLLCINFSYDWANVNPIRFVIAGLCGVVSLLMMFSGFYGIYIRIYQNQMFALICLNDVLQKLHSSLIFEDHTLNRAHSGHFQ